MRKATPDQIAASRKNGSKGKGPTSPSGKKAIRLNALKNGLFSTAIVVEGAGERLEDFERFKKQMWDHFQPGTQLEEMLVTDFIESRWRLQRIRRAESEDLKNRIENFRIQTELQGIEEWESLEFLKTRFLNLCKAYAGEVTPAARKDVFWFYPELEEFRRKLSGRSEGVQFLIDQMKDLEERVRSTGFISLENALLMLACCGVYNEAARWCFHNNWLASTGKSETDPDHSSKKTNQIGETWEPGAAAKCPRDDANEYPQPAAKTSTGKSVEAPPADTHELARRLLAFGIDWSIRFLMERKKLLLLAEEQKEKALENAVIVSVDASQRFSRAETALERRMYRALTMLLAVRQDARRGRFRMESNGQGASRPGCHVIVTFLPVRRHASRSANLFSCDTDRALRKDGSC